MEKEREQERIRTQKEREEERKRRQEEERLREEEEEKERKRIADAERKARIERETRLREEARKRKEEEERRAALKAQQEQTAKEEQEALRREQERRREEDEKKRVALIEAKKREISLLKKATKKRDGRVPSPSPSPVAPYTPSTPSTATKPRPSSAVGDGPRSRQSSRRPQPLSHAQSLSHPHQTKVSTEKDGSLTHVSSSPASLAGSALVESPTTTIPLVSVISQPQLSHSIAPLPPSSSSPSSPVLILLTSQSPSLSTLTSMESSVQPLQASLPFLSQPPHASHLPTTKSSPASSPRVSSPASSPPVSSPVKLETNPILHATITNQPESKPNKGTTDTWLEDNMRASNARLYQSSVVVPARAHARHDKPLREATPDALTQPSSAHPGQELPHDYSDPRSHDRVHDSNLPRPSTGSDSQKADVALPKGVYLSKELIASNYPTTSLNTITHLDLSLESINKV